MLASEPVFAQKTDIVRLANGDRFTGEVKSVRKGQLQLSTDDAGTIYLEWIKVVSLESVRRFDVTTSDGRRFYGSLAAGAPRTLIVRETTGDVSLPGADVTVIAPIGAGFLKRLDGSFDLGFSYTRSSAIAQLSMNSNTAFRVPAWEARLDASATLTENANDGVRDDRATLQAGYFRFLGQHLFVGAGGGFESNESLGLILRSQVAGTAGVRLVNSNRAQLSISAGVAGNDEQNVDADATQNIEGILTFRTLYYAYDRPRTNFDFSIQYYPSLSNWGRQRLQLDPARGASSGRRLPLPQRVRHVRQPAPHRHADRNDVGVVLSFGWTY